jgi:hypothetical protein
VGPRHGPGLKPEDLAAWCYWQEEAHRYGVDPDVSRDELAALIEGSTVEILREEHRDGHAGDFVRWGRRGGHATARRYGTAWMALLARRRWGRITAELLSETFAAINGRRR